jgi:hypothetical protein
MTRTIVKLSKGILLAGTVAACLVSAPVQAQVEIQISPPAWFIATNRPTYYQGRPAYWYGNRWHYREGRAWRTYREEPAYLRDQRGRNRNSRYDYGRGRDGGYRRGNDDGDRRR